MIEQALQVYLKADADVAALVSTRVYPALAPQDAALPYITYERVSTQRLMTHDGQNGLIGPRIQIDCWASTYGGAKTLADKVRLCMNGHKNAYGETTGTAPNDYVIQGIVQLGELDLPELPQTAGEKPVYRVSMDFEVWYEETVPTL